jgi:rfaE bifunctional protein kinase chain/domain
MDPATDSVLVVGDSMLDRYWQGAVDRISPEAPVPVLRFGREWQRAGGAANVAVNLRQLGCPATLATLLGEDEAGARLSELLHENGVVLHAVRSNQVPTTQKIRAVCRQQQLLRIDIEVPAPDGGARALADLTRDLLPHHRWLVLSDYGKGCLWDIDGLLRRAKAHGVRSLVDPKGRDFERYRGAWLLKPNESEAATVTGAWHDEPDFEARMQRLRERLELSHLLVTRGERGMALFSADRAPLSVPAQAREVYDVSGAGDTVLAALASALAGGRPLDDAVRIANHAAGIVVGKFGTASVSRDELQRDAAWSLN